MEEVEEDSGLGVLRTEWQGIQKKTFTKWCNAKMRPVATVISDLFEDFRDGKNLALLLQAISGESLPRPERGNMRLHKVTNVSKCLDFVQRKGVKLVGIGAEEIVDGNEKMTLGMIWTIILRFALHGVGDSSMSARDGLLLWCQAKTKPYTNVSVQNFSKSWVNGLAFCALIHRHRPDLIDYDKLNPSDGRHNLELAFSIAETKLDIPRLLDIDDIDGMVPDEKSVMTYVSLYYHAFATSHESETAVKRLADSLALLDEIEKKKSEFEDLASKILEWINTTTGELQDRAVETDDLEFFKKMDSDLSNFREQVKPKWEEEKNNLENAHKTLRTLHRINDLADYIAPEHLSPNVINAAWSVLDHEDRNRLKWIKDNLKRHRNIDHLYRKFIHKCNLHESFASESRSELSCDHLSSELSGLMAAKRRHDTLTLDISGRDNRLPQISQIYSKLEELNFEKMAEVSERYNGINQDWADIKSLSEQYREELDKRLQVAQDLDEKRAKFALEAANLNSKIESITDQAGDAYLANSPSDVTFQIDSHEKLRASVGPIEEHFNQVINLEREMHEISEERNPYSRITGEVLKRDLENMKQLINIKEETLVGDKVKFENHSVIEEKLNAIIEEIDIFQNQTMEKLNTMDVGTLEEQKSSLIACDAKIHEFYEPRLPELSKLINEINETGIDTDVVPLSTLASGFHKLSNIISSNINVIENSILLRDASSLSEHEMTEYRRMFNNLDRQKVGYLSLDEFRNFLVATGHKVTPGDANGDKEFADIVSKVDNDDSKRVCFENFLNYLADKTKRKTGSEDMIDAFKVIAEGKPYITAEQLRRELPEKAERCISKMPQYTGEDAVPGALDYVAFTADLCGFSDL